MIFTGTGKTATVKEVIRTLKKQTADKELPEFEFVEINGKIKVDYPFQK